MAELEQLYGYGGEELARRFDRSLSWVSRRLALVDLLPEPIQQQVREGKLSAHVAMKFLVPVARLSLDDCERMAAALLHRAQRRLAGAGAAEIAAFAERFGFHFAAHEIGDANRSARVERPFAFIENNFLAGRTFASWEDLNQQARQWCDKVNSTYKKHLLAVPRELFAVEQLHLKPLPAWTPEVYRLHQRLVDIEGYVALHINRYSVPLDWIGRRVEVRETPNQIEIQIERSQQISVCTLGSICIGPTDCRSFYFQFM